MHRDNRLCDTDHIPWRRTLRWLASTEGRRSFLARRTGDHNEEVSDCGQHLRVCRREFGVAGPRRLLASQAWRWRNAGDDGEDDADDAADGGRRRLRRRRRWLRRWQHRRLRRLAGRRVDAESPLLRWLLIAADQLQLTAPGMD